VHALAERIGCAAGTAGFNRDYPRGGADVFLEFADTAISLHPCDGTSLRAVSYTKRTLRGSNCINPTGIGVWQSLNYTN